MERSNGVMPEDGGHDSSYQGLGMVHATRYLDLLAKGTLRDSLYRALRRGEKWELSRAYGIFSTPVAFLIDERGIIAADVAVGVDAILALAAREQPLTV